MDNLTLVHLKRAIYSIPNDFESVYFDSNGKVVINRKEVNEFEYYPNDFDYNIRNVHIDSAFSNYMRVSEDKIKFLDASNGIIKVVKDGKVSFINKYMDD